MSNPTGKGGFQGRKEQINRLGRPRSFDALRALGNQIAAEVVTDKEGKPVVIEGRKVTRVELIMRSLAGSSDPRKQQMFLEYVYGKVPQATEVTGKDGGPIETKTSHDLTKLTPEELNELRTIVAKTTPDDTPIPE